MLVERTIARRWACRILNGLVAIIKEQLEVCPSSWFWREIKHWLEVCSYPQYDDE